MPKPIKYMPIQMFNWVSRPQQEFHLNAAATGLVLMVMPNLREKKNFRQVNAHIVEINTLENNGDRVLREALVEIVQHKEDMSTVPGIWKVEDRRSQCDPQSSILDLRSLSNSWMPIADSQVAPWHRGKSVTAASFRT